MPLWWWIGFGVGVRAAAGSPRRGVVAVRERRRGVGRRYPGRLGAGDRRICLVDRAGERRHGHLGIVLSNAVAVAGGDQPHRRNDAARRGGQRRHHADPASRPPRPVLLVVHLSEHDGIVAADAQPAVVGFRVPALLHPDVAHVLLYRRAARFRDGARPGEKAPEADILRASRARVARLGATLEQSSDGLRHHGGDHGADGDLGAQRRRARFRRRHHPRLALDTVPALFLFRRGDLRVRRWSSY